MNTATERNRQICLYVEVSKDEYINGIDTDVLFGELAEGTRGYSVESDGIDYYE